MRGRDEPYNVFFIGYGLTSCNSVTSAKVDEPPLYSKKVKIVHTQICALGISWGYEHWGLTCAQSVDANVPETTCAVSNLP